MRSRNVVYSLLLIVALLSLAIIRRWQEPQRKEAFNRRPARLEYYQYALCRMQCQKTGKKAIEEIMHKGIINFNKSNRRYQPCPTFALQGRTRAGRYLRIIFAQCDGVTRVVNVYDLEHEMACTCSEDLIKIEK